MRERRPPIINGYLWVQAKVLNHLRTIEGAIAPLEKLIPVVWPNPDTEPEELGRSAYVIRFAVHCLRNRGFPIATVGFQGYRFKPLGAAQPIDGAYRRTYLGNSNGQQSSGRTTPQVSGRSGKDGAPAGRRRDLAA